VNAIGLLGVCVAHYLALLHGKKQASDGEKSAICAKLKLTPETITTAIPLDHVLVKDIEFSPVARVWIKSILIHTTRIEHAEFRNRGLTPARMLFEATHDLTLLGMTKAEIDSRLSIYPDAIIKKQQINSVTYHRLFNIRITLGGRICPAHGKPQLDEIISAIVFRILYLGYSTMISKIRLAESSEHSVCLVEAYEINEKPE
jgi:hypothetical protein